MDHTERERKLHTSCLALGMLNLDKYVSLHIHWPSFCTSDQPAPHFLISLCSDTKPWLPPAKTDYSYPALWKYQDVTYLSTRLWVSSSGNPSNSQQGRHPGTSRGQPFQGLPSPVSIWSSRRKEEKRGTGRGRRKEKTNLLQHTRAIHFWFSCQHRHDFARTQLVYLEQSDRRQLSRISHRSFTSPPI